MSKKLEEHKWFDETSRSSDEAICIDYDSSTCIKVEEIDIADSDPENELVCSDIEDERLEGVNDVNDNSCQSSCTEASTDCNLGQAINYKALALLKESLLTSEDEEFDDEDLFKSSWVKSANEEHVEKLYKKLVLQQDDYDGENEVSTDIHSHKSNLEKVRVNNGNIQNKCSKDYTPDDVHIGGLKILTKVGRNKKISNIENSADSDDSLIGVGIPSGDVTEENNLISQRRSIDTDTSVICAESPSGTRIHDTLFELLRAEKPEAMGRKEYPNVPLQTISTKLTSFENIKGANVSEDEESELVVVPLATSMGLSEEPCNIPLDNELKNTEIRVDDLKTSYYDTSGQVKGDSSDTDLEAECSFPDLQSTPLHLTDHTYCKPNAMQLVITQTLDHDYERVPSENNCGCEKELTLKPMLRKRTPKMPSKLLYQATERISKRKSKKRKSKLDKLKKFVMDKPVIKNPRQDNLRAIGRNITIEHRQEGKKGKVRERKSEINLQHNYVEQERRKELRQRFAELALVVFGRETKSSKIVILQEAVLKIMEVEKEELQLVHEFRSELKEHNKLSYDFHLLKQTKSSKSGTIRKDKSRKRI